VLCERGEIWVKGITWCVRDVPVGDIAVVQVSQVEVVLPPGDVGVRCCGVPHSDTGYENMQKRGDIEGWHDQTLMAMQKLLS